MGEREIEKAAFGLMPGPTVPEMLNPKCPPAESGIYLKGFKGKQILLGIYKTPCVP
jgi:hypothetical protein